MSRENRKGELTPSGGQVVIGSSAPGTYNGAWLYSGAFSSYAARAAADGGGSASVSGADGGGSGPADNEADDGAARAAPRDGVSGAADGDEADDELSEDGELLAGGDESGADDVSGAAARAAGDSVQISSAVADGEPSDELVRLWWFMQRLCDRGLGLDRSLSQSQSLDSRLSSCLTFSLLCTYNGERKAVATFESSSESSSGKLLFLDSEGGAASDDRGASSAPEREVKDLRMTIAPISVETSESQTEDSFSAEVRKESSGAMCVDFSAADAAPAHADDADAAAAAACLARKQLATVLLACLARQGSFCEKGDDVTSEVATHIAGISAVVKNGSELKLDRINRILDCLALSAVGIDSRQCLLDQINDERSKFHQICEAAAPQAEPSEFIKDMRTRLEDTPRAEADELSDDGDVGAGRSEGEGEGERERESSNPTSTFA